MKMQGVIRASGRGVPKIVKQDIAKKKSAHEAARGTTKVAVLKGDTHSENLLVGSCVDQKVYYMISTAAEFIVWVVKEKKNVQRQDRRGGRAPVPAVEHGR